MRIERLATISGLSRGDVSSGFELLANEGIVRDLGSRFPIMKRFSMEELLGSDNGPQRFTITGALFDNGIWSRLDPEEKVVLIAVRAILRNEQRFFSLDDDLCATEETEWREKMESLGPAYTPEFEGGDLSCTGAMSFRKLATLTGLGEEVAGVLESLQNRNEVPIQTRTVGSEVWIHLPASFWSPAFKQH